MMEERRSFREAVNNPLPLGSGLGIKNRDLPSKRLGVNLPLSRDGDGLPSSAQPS